MNAKCFTYFIIIIITISIIIYFGLYEKSRCTVQADCPIRQLYLIRQHIANMGNVNSKPPHNAFLFNKFLVFRFWGSTFYNNYYFFRIYLNKRNILNIPFLAIQFPQIHLGLDCQIRYSCMHSCCLNRQLYCRISLIGQSARTDKRSRGNT